MPDLGPPEKPSGKLDGVQVFRGIAAMLVVFHHAASHIDGFPSVKDGLQRFFVTRFFNTDLGMIGVDLFFVVSGFIMVYTTFGRDTTPVQFLKKRALRIYPLYWFFSLVVIALHATPYLGRIGAGIATVVTSFTLYPVFWFNLPLLRPALLPQGWTLTYEILFYLVFAATMRLRPWVQLTLIAVGFAGANAIASFVPGGTSPEVALFRDCILLEFPFGMLLARLLCDRTLRLSHTASCALLAAGALLLAPYLLHLAGPRVLILGMPAFVLIAAVVLRRDAATLRLPRWLVALGDASYSIYITHVLVLELHQVGYIRIRFLREIPCDVTYVLLVVATALVGGLSYVCVERPLLRLCRRLI